MLPGAPSQYQMIKVCGPAPASSHTTECFSMEGVWLAGSFDPVFKFTALLYLLGTAFWNKFCTGEVVFS